MPMCLTKLCDQMFGMNAEVVVAPRYDDNAEYEGAEAWIQLVCHIDPPSTVSTPAEHKDWRKISHARRIRGLYAQGRNEDEALENLRRLIGRDDA